MKKNFALIILALIVLISIIGMIKVVRTETTGMASKTQHLSYAGYNLVTTDNACYAIHCRIGDAYPVGVDERGHIICQCREDPSWLQYRVTPFRTY
jgi:hypothetical protein